MEYNKTNKLKVATLFSGYDSQCLALSRLKQQFPDFDYELVLWSEIDKYAIDAHNALFPQWSDKWKGDVSKIDWNSVQDFDLLTYSSPCQDFSMAGKQKGGEKGREYRVRKLTPRECFRLMDVDDEQIDKIQNSGVSESQQYKLAGNSIVVNVLTNIFRKMFVEKDNENEQLSLF